MATHTIIVSDMQYRRLKSNETQYINLPIGNNWDKGDTLIIKTISNFQSFEKKINIMGTTFAFVGSVPAIV